MDIEESNPRGINKLIELGFNARGEVNQNTLNSDVISNVRNNSKVNEILYTEVNDFFERLKKQGMTRLEFGAENEGERANSHVLKFYGNITTDGKARWLFEIDFPPNGQLQLILSTRAQILNKSPDLVNKFPEIDINKDSYLILLTDENKKDIFSKLKSTLLFNQPKTPNKSPYTNQGKGKANMSKKNLDVPLNQILYGPPGTGKTFKTIEEAVKAADPEFYLLIMDKEDKRKQLTERYQQLSDQGRISFVTFHQSYGYEEFVEGLKARTTADKKIEYVVESGIFKSIADNARSVSYRKKFAINPDAKVWKISIDGTGKSEVRNYCFDNKIAAIGWGEAGDLLAEDLEDNAYYQNLGVQARSSLSEFSQRAAIGDIVLCIGSQRKIQAVGVVSGDYQFVTEGASSYTYYCNQRDVNWLVKDISVDCYELNGGTNFTQKTFYELWRFGASDVFELLRKNDIDIDNSSEQQTVPENYVLIIDEINRGNISKIFGELITLIEPSKRKGSDEELELLLPQSGKTFSVPDNLYIIGTMNTADRSLAIMDTALRRRFDFIEMMPVPELFKEDNLIEIGNTKISLSQLLNQLNKRIEVLYDREHTLGHAFLFPAYNLVKSNDHQQAFEELRKAFKNKIIPLLEEYFYEDWNKIRLVLGDNLKSEKWKLVHSETTSYNELFGNGHDLEVYDDNKKIYSLKPFDGEDSIWNNPLAYIEIYTRSTDPEGE
jgi:5-methylcytosine-specific restriction protein B